MEQSLEGQALVIWIGAFAKALIEKGVLTKEEVVAQLESFMEPLLPPGVEDGNDTMRAMIANMIATVHKW